MVAGPSERGLCGQKLSGMMCDFTSCRDRPQSLQIGTRTLSLPHNAAGERDVRPRVGSPQWQQQELRETPTALESQPKGWTDIMPAPDFKGWTRLSMPPGKSVSEIRMRR